MNVSFRPYFMASIAAVGASAIALAPLQAPPPEIADSAHRPTATRVVSHATVDLLAAVERTAPTAIVAVLSSAATPGDPVVQNTASDLIVAAWNAVLPWIDYGVNLTDYVLGFIPGLNIIGDQVSILY